jgi:methyl-accepting chemotaxis protein
MSGDVDEVEPAERRSAAGRLLSAVTPDVIRRSFALKFAFAFLLIGLLIGATGIGATEQLRAETAEDVESEYRGVAAGEADLVGQWVDRYRRSTALISKADAWSGGGTSLQAQLERRRPLIGPAEDNIHLIDTGGEVIASTSLEEGTPVVRNNERTWIEERDLDTLQASRVVVSEAYQVGDRTYVGFLSPTGTGSGRYIYVEASVGTIRERLQGAERAAGGFTQVVDESSGFVMIDEQGTDTLDPYTTSTDASVPIREATALREGTREAGVLTSMSPAAGVLDEEYTVGYAPVEGTDWAVLVHAPRSSVFGFVRTVSQWGLYATLFVLVLTVAIGGVVGLSTSRALDRLRYRAEELEEGNLDTTLYTGRVDSIGRLYDGFANMRDSLREQIEAARRANKAADVSRAEAREMADYLQNKADEYAGIMQECAAGDLTRRLEADGENDATDRIATEFNDMIEELERTTGQLKRYVDEVERAGAEVEESADTVGEAAEQVATSVGTIAGDAADQRARLREVSAAVDEVATALEGEDPDLDAALADLREVSTRLSAVADLAERTQEETEHVSAAAEEQAAELTEVSERAEDLQRYAGPLREILDRFETEQHHEFVFSVGPGSGSEGGDAAGELTRDGGREDPTGGD